MRVPIALARPASRVIARAVDRLESGGVVVYPTDTVYGIGCDATQAAAVERIYRIRGHQPGHPLTLLLAEVADATSIAELTPAHEAILGRCLPGPYTFVLPARTGIPVKLRGDRRTVGVRVPGCVVTLELIRALGRPLVNTSATVAAEVTSDPQIIEERIGAGVDLILDAGPRPNEASTVIDLTGEHPTLLRAGRGDPERCGIG